MLDVACGCLLPSQDYESQIIRQEYERAVGHARSALGGSGTWRDGRPPFLSDYAVILLCGSVYAGESVTTICDPQTAVSYRQAGTRTSMAHAPFQSLWFVSDARCLGSALDSMSMQR